MRKSCPKRVLGSGAVGNRVQSTCFELGAGENRVQRTSFELGAGDNRGWCWVEVMVVVGGGCTRFADVVVAPSLLMGVGQHRVQSTCFELGASETMAISMI